MILAEPSVFNGSSFKGGFQGGDTSNNPGDTVVERSIALNEPVVYVSANYRLTGGCHGFTVFTLLSGSPLQPWDSLEAKRSKQLELAMRA